MDSPSPYYPAPRTNPIATLTTHHLHVAAFGVRFATLGDIGVIRRIARWQVMLSKYDIVYVSQKVIKGSVIAKFLAERAADNYELMKLDFSYEELMTISKLEEDDDEEETW